MHYPISTSASASATLWSLHSCTPQQVHRARGNVVSADLRDIRGTQGKTCGIMLVVTAPVYIQQARPGLGHQLHCAHRAYRNQDQAINSSAARPSTSRQRSARALSSCWCRCSLSATRTTTNLCRQGLLTPQASTIKQAASPGLLPQTS